MAFNFGTLVQSYLENMPVIGTIIKATELGRIPANAVSDLMNGSPENNFALSLANKTTEAGPTGLDVWQNETNRQNYQDRWKMDVAGMQEAGLNPALLYGGGSSGGSAPQVSPSAGSGLADLLSVITIPAQLKKLNAETENIKSLSEKNKSESRNIDLESEFKSRTMDAREQSVRYQNDLTYNEYKKVEAERERMNYEISKMVAETNEADVRAGLYYSQKKLADAEANQIAALLPFKKLYMSAQTDNERNEALYYAVRTAYENQLLDLGMAKAVVGEAKAKQAIEDWKASFTNPDYSPSVLQMNDDDASRSIRTVLAVFRDLLKVIPFNAL